MPAVCAIEPGWTFVIEKMLRLGRRPSQKVVSRLIMRSSHMLASPTGHQRRSSPSSRLLCERGFSPATGWSTFHQDGCVSWSTNFVPSDDVSGTTELRLFRTNPSWNLHVRPACLGRQAETRL